MTLPRKEKFTGSLVGQALGDAMGFPMEGYVPEVCSSYALRVKKQLETEGGAEKLFGRSPFPFGQYTDDTQLARDLAESIVEKSGFDPVDYARRVAAIFKEGRVVGRGRATEEAAKKLIEGTAWDASGTPAPSAGNGSAMRAGPVGLFFYDDPVGLVSAATDQGRITHLDPRCSAGAVAIAGAVATALTSEKIDTPSFIENLTRLTSKVDDDFAKCLQELPRWLKLPPEEAVKPISEAGEPIDVPIATTNERWDGISPFVVPSVLWSLYSFLRTPDDYMETIYTAISVGGDVDTTAAMAGAVSGAYVGIEGIRADLASLVTDRGEWGAKELTELAEKIFNLKS